MKQEKDAARPDTTSYAYDTMRPAWDTVQTVLEGTTAMRRAGKQFLPQHHGETDTAYGERLSRNTLLNVTKLTLNSWVGRPFSDIIRFEETPEPITAILPNVDLVGNDAQVFCRNWFADGVAKAYSHVYVDFPRTDTVEGVRTVADDLREGVRPYWVHIKPEQIFFASAEVIAGREVLREIRMMEEVSDMVGFAELLQPQIRRVYIDAEGSHVQLYRKDDPRKEDSDWVLYEEYEFSLGFIPLVTFYAHRDDFMLGTPPLLDLADLNIAHWQSTADQRSILTVTRFPILALSGASDEGKELVIGPNRWLYSPDPGGKFYYVEHTGKAIAAGRQDLVDLEEQMAEYGADFLRKRPGNVTATARALDSAEATSPLMDMTIRFSEALDLVLEYTAAWLNLPSGGHSELTTDFGPEGADQAELTTLSNTRKDRDISRKAYLEELKRRGILTEEYDIEEDATQLEEETMDLFGNTGPPVEVEDEGESELDEERRKDEEDAE